MPRPWPRGFPVLVRKVRRILVVVVALAGCLAVAVGGAPGAGAAKAKAAKVDSQATLRIAQNVSPTTWDPLKWANPIAAWQFLSYPYDQLVEYSPKLKPQPMLATSWQNGSDGLSMTMKLRTGVKFQDGTAFDASAVKANFDRALSMPSYAALLSTLKVVEVVDTSTVKLVFTAPTYNFADLLAGDMRVSSMVSPKSLNDPNLTTKPVGTGPYSLVSSSSSGAVLERVDDHWDKTSGLAKRVEVSVIIDSNARLNAIQSGLVDLGYVTLDQVPAAQGANVKLVEFSDTVAVQSLILNYTRPAVSDPRVRKAISLTFDRNALATIAYGAGNCTPTQQMFTKFTSAYSATADKKQALKPNIAEAKKLLSDAGVKDLTLQVVVPTGNASLANVAQLEQQQLAQVGIKMNLVQQPSSQAVVSFADGQFDAYVTGVTGAAESQALIDANLRAKGFGFGIPDYLATEVDKAAHTALGASRDEQYQKINKELVEQPVHIPICQNKAFFGGSGKAVGTENVAYGRVSQGILEGRRVGIKKGN